jgi:hypothetical protein
MVISKTSKDQQHMFMKERKNQQHILRLIPDGYLSQHTDLNRPRCLQKPFFLILKNLDIWWKFAPLKKSGFWIDGGVLEFGCLH